MPVTQWFAGDDVTVVDWWCPGAAIGSGPEERAPAYELSVGRTGSHAIATRDGETVVDPTQLLCLAAGETFRPVRRALGLDRRTRIALGDTAMAALVGDRAPGWRTRSIPMSAETALAHHALLRAASAPTRDELALHTLALDLAARACSAPAVARAPDANRALRVAVREVRERLVRDYAAPLTLTLLARHVGLSSWHLSRSFRALVGVGLHDYRNRVRLFAALERLARPRRPPLAQLALDLGFCSHSHFTRAFRAFFGKPASAL